MSVPSKVNWWEAGAATLVLVIGLYLGWSGWGYGVGRLNNVGPGFFPLVVGVILVALALGIFVQFWRSRAASPDLPWRPIVAITAGLIVFGLLVGTAGFVLATFALVLVSALGDRSVTPLRALLTALAVALLGYLIFIVLFRLPLNPFWW